MYAYIVTGGKQYKAAPGEKVLVEKIEGEPGAEVKFDKIVALVKDDSTSVIGKPYLANVSVTAEIVSTDQQDKVLVFKKLMRKNSRKLRGHRQILTTLKIKDIQGV